jgi:RNA polymerase primary sigma factor
MGEEETTPVVPAAPVVEVPPELDADGHPIQVDDDDDEDEQANMSLAAMEAALKPQVLIALDIIADDYVKLSAMQDSRLSATLNEDSSFSAKNEKAYQKQLGVFQNSKTVLAKKTDKTNRYYKKVGLGK